MKEIIDFCSRYKNIYCYGAGYYGKLIRVFLGEHGIEPRCFLITDIPKYKTVLDLKVQQFDVRKIEEESGIIICAGETYAAEIAIFLELHHIKDFLCIDEGLFSHIEKSIEYCRKYPICKNILVLLYHRIYHLKRDIRSMAISPEHFESHINYLKENYPILRFEEDWSNVRKPSIVLTFDDGYDDFYEYALPILEKYNVPAMLFVSSGSIGGKQGLWTDRLEQILFLSKKESFSYDSHEYAIKDFSMKSKSFFQIRSLLKKMTYENRQKALNELGKLLDIKIRDNEDYIFLTKDRLRKIVNSPYVSIGGHTVTHTSLSSELFERQKFEISICKSELEKIVEQPITCFSYPYGGKDDYTDETVAIAKHCGYQKVAAAFPGIASTTTQFGHIPRCGITDCSIDEFARQIRKFWTLFGSE